MLWGSKGVTKVSCDEEFNKAFEDVEDATRYSQTNTCIIENFIQRRGFQIDGDGFISDGKIAFFGVMDQHHNMERNPYAPIGLSYPSIQEEKYRKDAQSQIQLIFDKLGMLLGGFNFEYIIGEDDRVHILEVGPRNGGNLIPDTVQYACGVDMISASICACVGDEYKKFLKPTHEGVASSYVIHSMTSGTFSGIRYHDGIEKQVVYKAIFKREGEQVNSFHVGLDCLGGMVIRFDNVSQMNDEMSRIWDLIEIQTC